MNTLVIPWWNRLGVRLATAIAFVSIITLSVFLLLVLRSQTRHLMDQARRSAAIVNETITSSIEYDMLQRPARPTPTGSWPASAARTQIERLRLFDAIGRDSLFEGHHRDRHGPRHQGRVVRAVPRAGPRTSPPLTVADRTRVTQRQRAPGAGRRDAHLQRAERAPASGCHVHPPSQRVIGVVELGLLARLRSTRRRAALARTTIVLTC